MSATVSGLSPYDPLLDKPPREPRQELNADAFMNLLVAQLRFQDPLKGTDQQAFMNQLATMSSMQQQVEINDQLANLLKGNRFNEAVALIGRDVVGLGADGETISGRVTGVVSSTDGPVLKLDDVSLPYGQLTEVK